MELNDELIIEKVNKTHFNSTNIFTLIKFIDIEYDNFDQDDGYLDDVKINNNRINMINSRASIFNRNIINKYVGNFKAPSIVFENNKNKNNNRKSVSFKFNYKNDRGNSNSKKYYYKNNDYKINK